MRPILTWPDDRLRAVAQPILTIDDSVLELRRDLIHAMIAQNGLGIAAPQLGDARQMFLVDRSLVSLTTRYGIGVVTCINPEVLWTSDQSQYGEEGCLSFPNVYLKVKRPWRVRVRAIGLDGQPFEIEGEGLLARCLLHEYDHLHGRLLADHVPG